MFSIESDGLTVSKNTGLRYLSKRTSHIQ